MTSGSGGLVANPSVMADSRGTPAGNPPWSLDRNLISVPKGPCGAARCRRHRLQTNLRGTSASSPEAGESPDARQRPSDASWHSWFDSLGRKWDMTGLTLFYEATPIPEPKNSPGRRDFPPFLELFFRDILMTLPLLYAITPCICRC
jgi:hypothetical protein